LLDVTAAGFFKPDTALVSEHLEHVGCISANMLNTSFKSGFLLAVTFAIVGEYNH
jgi:hypothetical protein